MSIIWLVIWLIAGLPALHQWNGWVISLIICVTLDLFGGGSKAS